MTSERRSQAGPVYDWLELNKLDLLSLDNRLINREIYVQTHSDREFYGTTFSIF